MKNISFLSENFQFFFFFFFLFFFLGGGGEGGGRRERVKFSIYLSRRVFVM